MLTKRRLTALLAALACGVTWVVLVSPGTAGRAESPIGTTVRASVADDGSQSQYGGGDSQVSGNGRFDIFTSYSSLANGPGNGTHFDGGDNGCDCAVPNTAIYVRDLATGHTSQVSIGLFYRESDGVRPNAESPFGVDQPDNNSFAPSISANGRYISFVTEASNIVPDDDRDEADNPSIIVCDRGTPNRTGSFRATPGLDASYPSYFQCVRVAQFDQVVPGEVPHLDAAGDRIVWVQHNEALRGFHTIGYVASLSSTDGRLNTPTAGDEMTFPTLVNNLGPRSEPRHAEISPDGQWVVFGAVPVYASKDNGYATSEAIAEWKVGTDVPAARVDIDPTGQIVGTFQAVDDPDVSNGGTTVVFDAANNTDYTSYPDVYAVTVDADSVASGADDPVTSSVVVSRAPDGTVAGTGGDGAYPTVSADGRYVAFVTDRDGMFDTPTYMPGEDGGYSSCLSFDDRTSSAPEPTPSSSDSGSFSGNAVPRAAPASSASATPSAPGAGRLRPAEAPPTPSGGGSLGGDRTPCQVAVRDLVADRAAVAAGKPFGYAHLASPSRLNSCEPGAGQECLGDDDSENPVSLSDNGAQVGFDSMADDLVPKDTNDDTYNDAFVRTWTPTLVVGTVNFGTVQLGQSSDQSLVLTVSGFGPIPIGPISIGGTNPGDFTIPSSTCTNSTLHEPDSCVVTIEFTPSAPGPRSGTVIIEPPPTALVPDPDPLSTITVSGTGSVKPPPKKNHTPQFEADPGSVYFGTDIPLHQPGLTRTVTISNPGSGPLVLTHVSIVAGSVPGSSGDFTVKGPPCISNIPPGGSCTLTLTFIGRAVGLRDGVLRIADNTGGAPHIIPLGARIRSPKITVNPAVSPTGRVVTVTGTGFAPKRVVDIGFVQSGEQATVKADRHGRFSVGLVIFPNADEGPRTVTSRTIKVSPSISANIPLLVVLGTLESPTLVNRH